MARAHCGTRTASALVHDPCAPEPALPWSLRTLSAVEPLATGNLPTRPSASSSTRAFVPGADSPLAPMVSPTRTHALLCRPSLSLGADRPAPSPGPGSMHPGRAHVRAYPEPQSDSSPRSVTARNKLSCLNKPQTWLGNKIRASCLALAAAHTRSRRSLANRPETLRAAQICPAAGVDEILGEGIEGGGAL